jgi:hypothetical protein
MVAIGTTNPKTKTDPNGTDWQVLGHEAIFDRWQLEDERAIGGQC